MTAPTIADSFTPKIARQFTLEIPSHWLPAIINGDETGFSYSDSSDYSNSEDFKAYQEFCENEIPENAILDPSDISIFLKYHDAKPYGVLACDITETLVTVYD